MRCLCPKVYRGGAHTIPAWEGRCPDCPTTPPLFETRWHPELCPFPPGNWCSADSDLPPVTSSLKACSLGSETPQGALAVSPRHSLDADPNLPPCPPFILLAWQNAPPPPAPGSQHPHPWAWSVGQQSTTSWCPCCSRTHSPANTWGCIPGRSGATPSNLQSPPYS